MKEFGEELELFISRMGWSKEEVLKELEEMERDYENGVPFSDCVMMNAPKFAKLKQIESLATQLLDEFDKIEVLDKPNFPHGDVTITTGYASWFNKHFEILLQILNLADGVTVEGYKDIARITFRVSHIYNSV
jgi:hypothetical protein